MTRDQILGIVTAFYEKATTDILIGFHFRHIKNFDEHIPRIAHFWEVQFQLSSLKMSPFDLLQVHRPLKINTGQIDRWIVLFYQTLDESQGISEQDKIIWKEKLTHFQNKFKTSKIIFG